MTDIQPGCLVCGGLLGNRNKTGVCRATEACRKKARSLNDALYYQRHRPAVTERNATNQRVHRGLIGPHRVCKVCGAILQFSNSAGVDRKTPACREALKVILRERHAAWRASKGQPFRDRARKATAAWVRANPLRHAQSRARRRAEKLGVRYDERALKSIWPAPDHCPECRRRMTYSASGRLTKASPSFSLAIPALGYVTGNVRWLCVSCCVMARHQGAGQKCEQCGGSVNSKYDVCSRNPECRRERRRRVELARSPLTGGSDARQDHRPAPAQGR